MPAKVNIAADSRYPVDRGLARRTVDKILTDRQIFQPVVVEISIVGDRKIRDLNRRFRQLDESTNVLSFPLQENPAAAGPSPDGLLRLGDIVVSWPQARNVAVKSNRLISDVICDLVEHGLKHLLGEHHRE